LAEHGGASFRERAEEISSDAFARSFSRFARVVANSSRDTELSQTPANNADQRMSKKKKKTKMAGRSGERELIPHVQKSGPAG